jgi:Bacterial Ig domain/Malectin domain
MHAAPPIEQGLRILPIRHPRSLPSPGTPTVFKEDLVLQSGFLPQAKAPTPGVNFEGVGQGFMGPGGTWTVNVAPPDPNGAVGPSRYMQIVNAAIAIFDKSGTTLLGPVATNTLWAGFGGGCETDNNGDGTVVYDRAADRWIVSQFALGVTPFLQCVAVSTTGDPAGSYARYSFSYATFPDYPKMGVWPDAYYETFNMFDSSGTTFLNATVCAYDRAKMLAGQSATQQCFNESNGSLLPSTVDGPTAPPAGSPNFLLTLNATTQSLEIFKFHVDWTTPANSTLTGPTLLPVAAFSEACGGGTCIPQLNTTQLLDSLGDRLMFRLAYRNFGDHEALVVNHSVAAGSSVGVRWYEVRSPNGTPSIFQQGTYAPDLGYRWMGSIAMDAVGNIGLGFSTSSATSRPGAHLTGRLVGDPAGTMTLGESVLIEGPGSQTTVGRWGDYTALTVDPVDDCTFWYTNQYQAVDGGFNWHTRIGSFKLGPCQAGSPNLFSVTATPAVVEGSTPATGTVLLSNLAPSGGATVTLSSSNASAASAPASVVVAAGQESASFPITTSSVSTETAVVISGTYPAGTTKTATLTVEPSPTPSSLTLKPSSVAGGQPSSATVMLTGPAPAGGETVTLSSSSTGVATVPASVTIPEAASSGTFTVTTLTQTGTVSATISASLHGITASAALTVTKTVPIGNATFDPTLLAPECATVGPFCDTGGLIDGRDNMSGGPETNTPNTINKSCVDGTSGTYHVDESLDRLRVSTTDGTALAVGKTVTINATVWVWGATSDTLDLYSAPDATNPSWTFLGSLQATATGQQVLSQSFTLPAGSLQAIRGNWRYMGSASMCSSGAFDDHDDLIFAVQSTGDAGAGDAEAADADAADASAADADAADASAADADAADVSATDADAADASATDADAAEAGDTTPPVATITQPIDGSSVHATVTVTVTATDDVGVTKVALWVDGILNGTVTAPPFTFSLNTVSLADNAHALQAKAYDAAGNVGLSAVVSITVDNTPPTVAITSPASGATVSGTTIVTATASDDSPGTVSAVDFLRDGVVQTTVTTSPYTWSWDTTTTTPGAHMLSARARDPLGNQGTSANVPVTVLAPIQINCGGPTVTPFVADKDFAGGGTINHANTIDLSGVVNPAPVAVYRSGRIGNFTYTIPGYVPGSSHTIRLHFAETYFSTNGSRVFNVIINGATILSNFDIHLTTGAKNKAVAEQFTLNASTAGTYTIQFATVVNNSLVSGIEIK